MKRIFFVLALVLALSFSVIAEGATTTSGYGTITLGSEVEDTGEAPTTIAEALELAANILDGYYDDDGVSDPDIYKNLLINITSAYEIQNNEIDFSNADLSAFDRITINGNNKTFAGTDDDERDFIFEDSGTLISLQNITFNHTGVRINDGTVSFDNVKFQDIDATDLYDDNGDNDEAPLKITGGEVYITKSTFSGNTALNGGAVQITGGTVDFSNENKFTSNTANSNGGAVSISGGTVTFQSTNTFGQSGSINTAANGGAISVTGGTVTISDATFSSNTADTDGGAIYVDDSGTLTLGSGVTFNSNSATENGGALNLAGTVSISGGNFRSNSATGNGGSIYVVDGQNLTLTGALTFDGNHADNGGAIYLPEDSAAQINFSGTDAITFSNNYSETDGGAIYASNSSTVSFTPSVTFSKNFAKTGNGGAIWTYLPSQLPSSSMTFSGNIAGSALTSNLGMSSESGNGGAIYIAGYSSSSTSIELDDTNYVFSDNTAKNSGGAIYTVSADVTINGVEFTSVNTASNGGGGFVRSGGAVTVEDATLSNQTGAYGGAIWAASVTTVTNSTFNSNKSTASGGAIYAIGTSEIGGSEFTSNTSSGQATYQGGGALYTSGDAVINNSTFTSNSHRNNNYTFNGGGAVYSVGSLTLSGDIFKSNSATGNADCMGGAVFAYASEVDIKNVLFDSNRAQGNGGALLLYDESDAELSEVTFTGNMSIGKDGGAVYAQGQAEINLSYFTNNSAVGSGTEGGGGAVYFYQSGNVNNPGDFKINSSMLINNSVSSGRGGALYVNADTSTIDSCTFSDNSSSLTGEARGGAVYFSVQDSGRIQNSTFTGNEVSGGSTSYGGALATYGNVTLTMSTFTASNKATERGGGIYIGSGTLTISATIIVGNSATLGNDVWSDGSVASRGYNRVGTYGQGSANTSWTSAVGGSTDTDRSNTSWTTETFFGNAELDYNAESETVPPYIGSILAERERIMTLMLSEDVSLALTDRATNIIPNNRKASFPEFDQRGVSRWASVNDLSIGAVNFDGDINNPSDDDPNATYTIQSVMMSGIPNTLRSIGQTASLTALIRYTNGRTAYGVPYNASSVSTGEERVRWTSSQANTVKIDEHGNITALTTTPNNSYVTITVSTVRNSATGSPATDSRPVRVTGQYSNMNLSTVWQNYFTNYVQEITEEDISLMLVDASTATVRSSSFKRNFKNVWNVAEVNQITDLTSSTPTFTTPKSYRASDGLVNSKNAAVNINFQNRTNGDIFPLTYTWSFSGDEIKAILGSDFSNTATLNASVAERLFNVLRVDFVGSSKIWQVLGGSGISAKDAYDNGALTLTKSDAERGATIALTAYLANVNASGNNEGPQLVKGSGSKKLLIIPDGVEDGAISGTMWMVQSASSKTNTGGNGNTNTDIDTPTSNGDGGGSGGGGGCNSLSFGLASLALAFLIKRK